MADAVVVQEFLATLGYRVDEASQRRFVDSLESIGKTVAGLGLGLTGLAGTIAGVVSSMAGSASQMNFVAQNLGESVTSIERLIYSWQRLGVAPDAVIKGLQTIQQMKLTDPGTYAIFSSEEFGGKGTPTEQLEHFLQKFKTESESERRITLERFKGFDFSMLMTAVARGDQAGAGGDEFNFVNRLFHFDPNRFGKESSAFEQAWMSFHLRLNTWYKSEIAEPLTLLETQGLTTLSKWIDQHAPAVNKRLEEIGRAVRDAFLTHKEEIFTVLETIGRKLGEDASVIEHWVRQAATWFSNLDANSQQVLGIFAALAALAINPGMAVFFASFGAFVVAFQDLVKYESTGKSDLGIDWGGIGGDIKTVSGDLKDIYSTIKDVAGALGGAGGLNAALRVFVELMATKLLPGPFGPLAQVLIAARELNNLLSSIVEKVEKVIFGEERAMHAARLRQLGPNPTPEQMEWAMKGPAGAAMPAGPSTPQQLYQLLTQNIHDLGADADRQRAEEAKRRGNQPGTAATPGHYPQLPPEQQHEAPSWFRRFMNLGIADAHGEELPQNLKQVDTSLRDLKDSMDQWQETLLEAMLGKDDGGGGGGGGSRGAGGGGPVNWKDPEVMRALSIFQGMGYSMDDAVAIVTNLWRESGVKTGAINPTGHEGVAQWDRRRQAEFFMLYGKRIRDATLEEQAKFIDHEFHNKEQPAFAQLQQAHGVRAKTAAVGRYYERPGDEAEIQHRADLAGQAPSSLWSNGAVANFNNQRAATITVNNTNNVAATDPGLAANELDRMHARQWSDLQRRLQPTFH